MHYAGWVPTVIGRLAFAMIGCGSHPSRCWKKEDDERFVVMQCRNLVDLLVPFATKSETGGFVREFASNIFTGRSGRFTFVMNAAVANQDEYCAGCVYVVPTARKRKMRNRLRAWIRQEGRRNSWKHELEEIILDDSIYIADFVLDRGGHVKIQTRSHHPEHSNSNVLYCLANQVFFFLKDITHVHQHHDSSHDAITELTIIRDNSDNKDWVRQTQKALFQAIIRYKRFRNEKALLRSSGILAYLKSFQELYGNSEISSQHIHTDAIEKSLNSSLEELKYYNSKTVSLMHFIFSIFFGLFAFVISISLIARLGNLGSISVDERIINITRFSVQNPAKILAITIFSSIFIASVTHRIELTNISIFRWLTRTFQIRSRYWFIAILIFMCAPAYWLCYRLLF